MSVIFKALVEKYPGRWPDHIPFVEGCRGPAVWSPNAKNPTAVIYQKHGAYRFSSEKMFHPYSEIIGPDFTRQYEEDRIGHATEGIYYCGKAGYLRKFNGGIWRPQPKEDVVTHLLTAYNLSTKRPAPNIPSDIERALHHIQQARVVDGAMPLVFDKREVVKNEGMVFLNTSRVKAMEPCDPHEDGDKWGQHFPWIAGWLGGFFASRKELIYFLTWLKLYWQGAYEGNLQRGQAMFLVGSTDRGKTLMNAVWIPSLVGGGADASNHLVLGKEFNKNLVESGHWHIDDAIAASNMENHVKFSERVKKLIANPKVPYRPMYVDEIQVTFRGRLMVTLNSDPQSLLLIPQLDINIADKLMVLKLGEKSGWKFKSNSHTEAQLRAESPAFLRWLHDWEPPAFLLDAPRFGMRSYINPEVRQTAAISGYQSDILSIMEIMWGTDNDLVELAKKGQPWEGSAPELFALLGSHPFALKLISGITTRNLIGRLNTLSRIPGTGVSIVSGSGGKKHSPKYRINPPEKDPEIC